MIELKGFQSFGDIYVQFSGIIAEKAKKCRIEETKFLSELEDSFRPQAPDVLSEEQVLDLLGMKRDSWRWILNAEAWKHLKPSMISTGIFWGPDVITLASVLKAEGWLDLKSSWVFREFEAHLESYSKALEPRISVAMVRVKPSPASKTDLPSDYNDMARKYQTYIFNQVRQNSKIKTQEELADIYQHVWERLIQAKILEKFRTTAEHELPSTLTFQETLDYLGITNDQWAREAANKSQWVPAPINGSLKNGDALFLTTDIQTLDVSGFLKDERGESKRPTVTGRGFKSYLARAISNHFKNLLRTRKRRHKERPVDGSRSAVMMNSTGACNTVRTEDGGVWEEGITDEYKAQLPIEDMVDLSLQLKAYDLDPTSEEDQAIMDTFLRGGVTLKDAMRKHGKSLRPVAA